MSATLAPGDLPLTQPLCDRARHEPLGGLAWGAARAGDAIATIGRAAAGAFDWERRWPRGHAPGTPPESPARGSPPGDARAQERFAECGPPGAHAPRPPAVGRRAGEAA